MINQINGIYNNPFAVNALGAVGQHVGATGGGPSQTHFGGGSVGGTNHYKELDGVAQIGAQKAQGFQNGLGGTNNPDNHKIFYAA